MGWWVGGGIDFLSTQSWLERPGSEKSLQIFFFFAFRFLKLQGTVCGKGCVAKHISPYPVQCRSLLHWVRPFFCFLKF
jgi:hypothetical protein